MGGSAPGEYFVVGFCPEVAAHASACFYFLCSSSPVRGLPATTAGEHILGDIVAQ